VDHHLVELAQGGDRDAFAVLRVVAEPLEVAMP
jgi:hypothetical protein